jgi:hypothetical protein
LAGEVGVLMLAVECLIFLAGVIGLTFVRSVTGDSWRAIVLTLIAIVGLLLAGPAFIAVRKTRSWKIEYDAVDWALAKAERRLHPARARCKRIASQVIVWVPSAMAALVLFFYPVVTHLAHPHSGQVGRYRVPIPWTYTIARLAAGRDFGWVIVVFRGSGRARFGITPFLVWPFWNTPESLSSISFEANTNAPARDPMTMEERRKEAAQVREFRSREVALTCWQYRRHKASGDLPKLSADWAPDPWLAWSADCDTSTVVHQQYFHAHFYGGEEDLRGFYRIIGGVTPVN